MSETEGRVVMETGRQTRMAGESQVRAVGSPLPIGGSTRAQLPAEAEEVQAQHPPAQSQNRTLPQPPAGPRPPSTGFQKAVGALKLAMPLMQKLIPLLDGNVATTMSNLLAPPPPPPPQPTGNLARIEGGMAELESAQHELREQVTEQNNSLRRVEDQLEMVREATDRNTLEQQELMEDLKAVGNKVNVLAMVLLGLLILSVVLNIGLFLHIRRVLP